MPMLAYLFGTAGRGKCLWKLGVSFTLKRSFTASMKRSIIYRDLARFEARSKLEHQKKDAQVSPKPVLIKVQRNHFFRCPYFKNTPSLWCLHARILALFYRSGVYGRCWWDKITPWGINLHILPSSLLLHRKTISREFSGDVARYHIFYRNKKAA